MNYYNEINPGAANWLRELIKVGMISPGEVDERDIQDVKPSELRGYAQCHFFAGIGVWSYALRLAGWPDDRPVWTGSCPCQPFSQAGEKAGFDDERHLWPAWYWLINQCRPEQVFGEQVASKDGLIWLDLVHADLESAAYSVRAVDLPVAGVGAPHIRQRLWFVADSASGGRGVVGSAEGAGSLRYYSDRESAADRMADPHGIKGRLSNRAGGGKIPETIGSSSTDGLVDTGGLRDDQNAGEVSADEAQHDFWPAQRDYSPLGRGPTNGFWQDAVWLPSTDGKFRPVEPGLKPLVDGFAERVGLLRGYGNAINARAAQAFIEAAVNS